MIDGGRVYTYENSSSSGGSRNNTMMCTCVTTLNRSDVPSFESRDLTSKISKTSLDPHEFPDSTFPISILKRERVGSTYTYK
jgi:hypothetical protein